MVAIHLSFIHSELRGVLGISDCALLCTFVRGASVLTAVSSKMPTAWLGRLS